MKYDHNTKLNIVISAMLSNDDILSLSLLYQPLIGANALAIYLALNSLVERNNMQSFELTHSELCDLLNISDIEFINARKVLEALSLMNTYYSKDENKYIYNLCTPLSPSQFLHDGVLGTYLEGKVGAKMYERIVSKFKIEGVSKEGYKNISTSFTEIFKEVDYKNKLVKKTDNIVGRTKTKKTIIKDDSFDMDYFLKNIDLTFLDIGPTEDFKNLITTVSNMYELSVDTMILLYNDSIDESQRFNTQTFKRKAKKMYSSMHHDKLPELNLTKEEDAIFTEISNLTPVALLSPFYKKENIPASLLERCEEIYEAIPLNRTMQNIMIMSVLKIKNGELPSVSYFETVYNSWLDEGIKTSKDAYLKYIVSNKENKNKATSTRRKKKEDAYISPETEKWMEEFKKSLESEE